MLIESSGFSLKYQLFNHFLRSTISELTKTPLLYLHFQCPATFMTRSGLANHQVVHTGERKWKCEYCGKGFRVKTTLQKHMHTHTKKHQHCCVFCEKGFFDKIQLKHHVESMHAVVEFAVQVLPLA